MESPSFFFVQTVNHYQPLSGQSAPVMTLNVYANQARALAKLDFSIQFVCGTEKVAPTVSVDLVRDGVVLTNHLVQFEQNRVKREDNFIVTTDSLTWSDSPAKGINLYQVTATLVSDTKANVDVFAGARSFNATVFPNS